MQPFLASVADELRALRDAGLGRRLTTLRPDARAATFAAGGRPVVVACSNDYLGLAADPRLAAAAGTAARDQGAGAGAARLVSGTRPAHEELEALVARVCGREAALTFGSGYAGNLAVLGALLGPGDLAVSDALNHASLIDGLRLSGATRRVVPHGDVGAVREALRDHAAFRRAVVVTEGLFSMDGDVAPLGDLAEVADAAGAALVVDDAHGTGVLGAGGGGAAELHGVGGHAAVVRLGTFGKAFGASGAFVAASRDVVDLVVHRGRGFVFSTAPAPPAVAAAAEGVRIAFAEPERRTRCLALADRLRAGLRAAGVATPDAAGPIVPVVIGDPRRAVAASERLLAEDGIYVPAIRPPTVPDGTARLRLTTSAAMDEGDVDRLAAAVGRSLA